MAEQHGSMILFARFARDDRKFLEGRQATVRRRDRFTGRLAIPEREEAQARYAYRLAAPRNVDAPDINVACSECRRAGNTVQEMLEAADITRSGVVLPAV